jgi:hypothetical protein
MKTTRDYNGIITADTLRAWTGTDAELARHVGLTRQAVSYARLVHNMPSTVDGRRSRKQGRSRTVCSAVMREAHRRGCTVGEVVDDLSVWAKSDDARALEGCR